MGEWPQEHFDDVKQFSDEEQNSANSNWEKGDSPLCLQATGEIYGRDDHRDEAGGANERQRRCTRSAERKNSDAQREQQLDRLKQRLEMLEQEKQDACTHDLTRRR